MAFSSIASNTGARSPGEELMTPSTSAVAVCAPKPRASRYEPRVLHRDDRLRREVLQQRDLLVGEGANFLALRAYVTQECALLSERYKQHCSDAGNLDGGTRYGRFHWSRRRIREMKHS